MTKADLTPIPEGARRFQGRPAGVVSRSIAGTIDVVTVALVVVLVYGAANGFLFLLDPRGFEPKQLRPLLSITTTMVVMTLYLTTAWALTSRSYGCHVMGLRVVDNHGRRCGWPRAFVRAAFCVLFPFGVVWTALTLDQRSLADIMLRTSVIHDWGHHGPADEISP